MRTGYHVARIPKSGSGSGGGGAQRMVVKSIADDHLVCRSLTGTTEGASDIYVAKPWLLRRTPFDGTAGRDGFTYTYSDSQNRVSDDGSTTEDQTVVPAYVVNDELTAIKVQTGLTVAPNLLDLNESARAWAAESAV